MALLAACGGGGGKHTVTGSVSLGPNSYVGGNYGSVCLGSSKGYGDINIGAAVTVKDQDGKLIATGQLERGLVGDGNCVLPFSVEVPAADFYTFEVAHRGGVNYSAGDLKAKNWTVSLTLGS